MQRAFNAAAEGGAYCCPLPDASVLVGSPAYFEFRTERDEFHRAAQCGDQKIAALVAAVGTKQCAQQARGDADLDRSIGGEDGDANQLARAVKVHVAALYLWLMVNPL
jgi:hypothetical protein